jgi:hydroxypyruvate reductase
MSHRIELHKAAREIFDTALAAVDARAATHRAVKLDGSHLTLCGTTFDLTGRDLYAIALGKAAQPMAAGLSEVLGNRLTRGVLTGPLPLAEVVALDRWEIFNGGHPLPNQQSLQAARAAFDLLKTANDRHSVIVFLISGGGSAMIEWPRGEITLEDLREANRLLVGCGANIAEINSVRLSFSSVKGGGLSRSAPDADQITLIVSDTNPGDEASVASGPTLAPPIAAPDAIEIVNAYELRSLLPASVLESIRQHESAKDETGIRGSHCVLLDNQTAIAVAAEKARQLGFTVDLAHDIREQPIEEGCRLLLSRLEELRRDAGTGEQGVCLISGGEFSCPVRGNGVGGRNLETVLRCAIELNEKKLVQRGYSVVLSAGTDGIDANSPAAGAIADDSSIKRANLLGLDAQRFLEGSDAFTFFDRLGDAIVTGPSGTNVRDLRVLLASN